MTRGLQRHYGRGELHFVTFSCYGRLPLLGSRRARDVFVKELEQVRAEYGFHLLGYVIMPEHVHLLVNEPRKGSPSTVLKMLKQRVSRKLRKQSSLGDGSKADTPQFWQPRFYDFNVFSKGKINEKLNYMHANPVIRGLVKHPRDWKWSSWSSYFEGVGLIAVDADYAVGVRNKTHPHKPRVGHPPS
jgi:putative transposase